MNISVFNGDYLQVGGYTFSNPKNLKILFMYGAGGGTRYSTGRLGSASSGYQVPTGFKLVVRAFRIEYNSATATNITIGAIGYGDTDVGLNSASGPTNAVNMGGSSNIVPAVVGGGFVTNISNGAPVYIEVPAGKYFFAASTAASVMVAFGELVAV